MKQLFARVKSIAVETGAYDTNGRKSGVVSSRNYRHWANQWTEFNICNLLY
jgi:hypothetical protein